MVGDGGAVGGAARGRGGARRVFVVTIRANVDALVVKAKHARLGEAHVAPLVELADAIAADRGRPCGEVPYPDPLSGGVRARVLLLMETPPVTSSARYYWRFRGVEGYDMARQVDERLDARAGS